jgi:hypothetical protein
MYQGERIGWGAYVDGESRRPASAGTPLAAIVGYLELASAQIPGPVQRLAEQLEDELKKAPRYACDCCGFLTLLNPGYYEICDVCGWDDDRVDAGRIRLGPDAPSGPNHVSLTQARTNFRRFGASKEASRDRVRDPRAEEHPS